MKEARNESIEILRGDKGYVDLSYPIQMTEAQKKKFINLLKEIFDSRVVKEWEVEQLTRDWRIGDRVMYPREWEPEEYLVLLDCNQMRLAMEKLGRSWYACELKDGDWRYKLMSFCDKNGLDLTSGDKLKIIKKFLKAQKEFIKFRVDLRKERTKLKKELERLDSSDIERHFKILESMGKLTEEELNRHFEKKMKISARLEEIDKELDKSFDEI